MPRQRTYNQIEALRELQLYCASQKKKYLNRTGDNISSDIRKWTNDEVRGLLAAYIDMEIWLESKIKEIARGRM